MKIITISHLDKDLKNNIVTKDLFVASTKEENNIVDALKEELGHDYVSSKTQTIKKQVNGKEIEEKLEKVYLTREDAQEIATLISKKLGYENNESLINYVLNKFEVICLLQREKQEEKKD